jgi:glycosyltransferase involved in cell wall biosynthesis
MNILFLSTWFPFPPDNGSKIRAYYLLKALGAAHRVTLVAFAPGRDSEPYIEHLGDTALHVHPVPEDVYRYVDLPRAVKFFSPISLAFWPSAAMRCQIEEVARSQAFDAVVAVQTPVAGYALRFPDMPKILDVDTALSYQMYESYAAQERLPARGLAWLTWQKAHLYDRWVFSKFDACTVVADWERDFLRAMVRSSSSSVEIFPNGVDCTHNHSGLAETQPHTLVYNGALTYSANYDAMQYFLAEIYPLIQRQLPDVTLTITGSTKGVDLDGLRLDESVHLTGYVDDVRQPVARSAACVVPIRQGGGTRLKILEAMALGTPVVATSKGAEGLDMIDGEHLLIADAPDAFAEAVVNVLRDTELRRRLATHARALVEARYDWGPIGQQFVELVEEVTAKRGRKSR